MEKNNEWYAIGKDFCLSDEALYQFTAAFREDIEAALAGKESSLSAIGPLSDYPPVVKAGDI